MGRRGEGDGRLLLHLVTLKDLFWADYIISNIGFRELEFLNDYLSFIVSQKNNGFDVFHTLFSIQTSPIG